MDFLGAGTLVFSIALKNTKNADPFEYILIVNHRR